MSNGIIIEYKYFSDYKKAILLFYYGFLIISLTNLIEYKIVKFDLLNDFIGAFFLLYSVKLLKSLPVSADKNIKIAKILFWICLLTSVAFKFDSQTGNLNIFFMINIIYLILDICVKCLTILLFWNFFGILSEIYAVSAYSRLENKILSDRKFFVLIPALPMLFKGITYIVPESFQYFRAATGLVLYVIVIFLALSLFKTLRKSRQLFDVNLNPKIA